MRKLELRKVLQFIAIAAIAIISLEIVGVTINQIKEVTTDYQKIDPYLTESPDLRMIGGHLTIEENIMNTSPELVRKLAIRASILSGINAILHLTFQLLILISVLQLIRTWKFSHFFIKNNYIVVRRISWLYLGWIACFFILYQFISVFFSYETISHYYNVSAIQFGSGEHVWHGFRAAFSNILHHLRTSIDLDALFVFFLLYILTLSMKEGIKLQEQADLTI